jgi:hypothetical protein
MALRLRVSSAKMSFVFAYSIETGKTQTYVWSVRHLCKHTAFSSTELELAVRSRYGSRLRFSFAINMVLPIPKV